MGLTDCLKVCVEGSEESSAALAEFSATELVTLLPVTLAADEEGLDETVLPELKLALAISQISNEVL